jgi:hypothetical protein
MSKIREYIAEIHPELVLMDGFDDCILGIASRCGEEQFVVYDYAKVIDKNMSHGMTEEEAIEFFDFNQECAYVGEHTPAFAVHVPHEITIDPTPSREGRQTQTHQQGNL